jgi:integrase
MFTYGGKRIGPIRRAFETACHQAGIKGVVFHDLRHMYVTNMCRAGVDYPRIMAITGYRTMDVLKRYHTIDGDDLHQAVAQLDTYVDTRAPAAAEPSANTVIRFVPP